MSSKALTKLGLALGLVSALNAFASSESMDSQAVAQSVALPRTIDQLLSPDRKPCSADSTIIVAGGEHSGGGSGVATYRPGAPKTRDNLIRVESLEMFKARQNKLLPETGAAGNDSISKSLDQDIKLASASREIIDSVSNANPEFGSFYALADEHFSNNLQNSQQQYEASKIYAPLKLIDDYGKAVQLSDNQEMVQIIRRTADHFEFDMDLWNKLEPLDRLDLRVHEDAYAVSWQNQSSSIQKFQLYAIQHYLSHQPMDSKEFSRLAKTEWGLIQVTHNPKTLTIPGLRVAQEFDRPFNDTGSVSYDDTALPPGVPMKSQDGMQCGLFANYTSFDRDGKVKFLYWDGKQGHTDMLTISEQEKTLVQKFRHEGQLSILSTLNAMDHPFVYEYMPVLCFDKGLFQGVFGFGKLKFIEVRDAYDVDKATKAVKEAREHNEVDTEIFKRFEEKIRATFAELKKRYDAKELSLDAYAAASSNATTRLKDELASLRLPKNFEGICQGTIKIGAVDAYTAVKYSHPWTREEEEAYAIHDLEEASENALHEAQTAEEIYASESSAISPPPVVYYPGAPGQLGVFIPTAKSQLGNITIVGKLGAYFN